jgi:hypothetical protein
MKATKYVLSIASMGFAFALSCMAGPTVIVTPPTVVVSTPAPVVAVPDSYVWDGSEYVGMVGGQYYYLGPGNTWVVMDTGRMHRFQTWQGGHADWRTHMTHNDRYRAMAHPAQHEPMERASAPSTRSGGERPATPPSPHVNPGQYGPP